MGVIVVKVGVLFVESDELLKGVVGVKITVFVVFVGEVGLLHSVIKN